MKLVFTLLDTDATLKYLNRKFNGWGYFADAISKNNLLVNGHFYAIAPEGINNEELHDFETGGLIFPPPSGDDIKYHEEYRIEMVTNYGEEMMIKSIAGFLNQTEDPFVLFEDYMAAPTDRWVVRKKPEYCLAGSTMQYVLWKGANELAIEEYLSMSASPSISTVILGSAKMERPNIGAKIDEASLNNMLVGIKAVFVCIYDGESYLLWIKNGETFCFQ